MSGPEHPKKRATEAQPRLDALLGELELPTKDEYLSLPVEELMAYFSRNHNKIREKIVTDSVPFYGLHGLPLENLQGVIADRSGLVEVTTFFQRRSDDVRILRMYEGASTSEAYTRKNQQTEPGGILVFNFESNPENPASSENVSRIWESINMPQYFWESLPVDVDPPASVFDCVAVATLGKAVDPVIRAEFRFDRELFDKHFVGVIDASTLALTASTVPETNMQFFPRAVIANRIHYQHVLSRALDLVWGSM